MEFPFVYIVVAVIVIGLLKFFNSFNFDFWSSRGIPGPKPRLIFGNAKDLTWPCERMNAGEFTKNLYDQFESEDFVGIYELNSPVLLIKNPKFVEEVLKEKFHKFADRGTEFVEEIEPLSAHLVHLTGPRWKILRRHFAPMFSGGKLKKMCASITECSESHFLRDNCSLDSNEKFIECRDLTARYATKVVCSCVFGFGSDETINAKEEKFREYGKRIFESGLMKRAKRLLRKTIPGLLSYEPLKKLFYNRRMHRFFVDSMLDSLNARRETNNPTNRREDCIDLLLKIKAEPERFGELSDTLLAAQLYGFFINGFETSSVTMSNMLYELALNETIQNKLREEIRGVQLEKDDHYDSIKQMKYLEKIFKETLRKYPPVMAIRRKCLESHTFEGTNLNIPPGTKIWIPVYAIHRDAKYYPDPEKFDPERFDVENARTRESSVYLPFGRGPRTCIGEKFANLQVKIGIATIVSNFKVEITQSTAIPYQYDYKSFMFLMPLNGVHLKFTKIQKIEQTS